METFGENGKWVVIKENNCIFSHHLAKKENLFTVVCVGGYILGLKKRRENDPNRRKNAST